MANAIALDIETDTSPLTDEEKAAGYTSRGLDPAITAVTAVSMYDGTDSHVLSGEERSLLIDLADWLRTSDADTVLTWNGSAFDFPFLDARMGLHGIQTPWTLVHNPDIPVKYEPTPGYLGGYDVRGLGANHVDVALVTRERTGRWCSLKMHARSEYGLDPVEVDRTKMHLLTGKQLREYVVSDAVTTYEIGQRMGLLAA